MQIPKEVRLGRKRWKVKLVNKSALAEDWNSHLVIADSSEKEIRLWKRLPPGEQWETFVHELLHIVWVEAGLKRDELEERVIDRIDKKLYRLLKENFGIGV